MKKKVLLSKRGRKLGQRNVDNIFGSVEDYEVGYVWETREDLSDSGVHRPKVACLHAGIDGVYSILISSRYRGEDNGYAITYSGPCVKDNGYNGAYNESLIKNYNSNTPVRIIRGAHKESPFAPLRGYRYDGLYLIQKYWRLNNKILFYFKRMQQAAPPWLKLIRRRNLSPTSELLENDRDISSYVSFIRDQNRPVSNLITAKEEQNNFVEEEEEGDGPLCSDSSKSISENPPEDISLPIENISEVTSVPPTNNESSICPENQLPESPPVVSLSSQPPTLTHSYVQPNFIEEQLISEPPPEPSETVGQSKTLIGGMPMPLMKYETCKEEYSAGFVVYEGVTTLPGQELVEVYNERVIYEEQETEVTECVNSDEEDEDCEVVEEEEVDCNYLRDFSNREIVTATELVETININSEMLPEGFYDVDVEDGPKYGHTRRYLEAAHFQNNHMNLEGPTLQNALSVAIIKSDEAVDLIPTEQVPESEMEIHKPNNNIVLEQNNYASIEMKHDVDNDNIVEESQIKLSPDAEASTSELQIGKVIGSCLYFDGNCDSKSGIESRETLNPNLEMPAFTLHDIQLLELREEEAKISKTVINNDEETSQDIDESSNGNMNSSVGEKPDSTSNMIVESNKPHCDCNYDDCPLKTFNLHNSIGILLKEFGSNNICKTLKTLSCWNIYKKILKTENTDKTMLKLPENNKKAVLPSPSDDNSEEEGIGFISNVHCGEDGLKAWNILGRSDEESTIQSNAQDDSNGSIVQSNNQELVTYTKSVEKNAEPPAISKFKALRIKAVEELCHVLLSKIQQIKASKEYGDALRDFENEALRDDLEQKVLQKFSTFPCFANEKKEVLLQHRKRKNNNLTVEDERSSNEIVQEVNQPVSKVRMVQYRRNIRTEINRTRILKINQTCEPISEDRENVNFSGEHSDEGIIITRETQVQDDDFISENCESTNNQSDEEMLDVQSDISEEMEDNSDENYEEDEENVLSTTDVSEFHNISKPERTNVLPSALSNGNEISSSSFQNVDCDADKCNPELFISNPKVSSPSTVVRTCEELCEPMSPLTTADDESSKKRKYQSQLLQSTKTSVNESLPSTSTSCTIDDNSDSIENFEGFSNEEISKAGKRKDLFHIKNENKLPFNFKVDSTILTLQNSKENSPAITTRPKSARTKKMVRRFEPYIM